MILDTDERGMKPLRVVHVITGLGDGGAEAVLYRLCAGDSTNRHFVVSLLDRGKYGPDLEQLGIRVDCLNIGSMWCLGSALCRLARLIRDDCPDIVQTWMYHGSLAGSIAAQCIGRMPVIWGIHHATLDPSLTKRTTLLVMRLLALLSRVIPSRIIYVGSVSQQAHQKAGYDAARGCLVPNGCVLHEFRPDHRLRDALRAELGIPGNAFVLGMVARYDPLKDHGNLLTALGILRSRGFEFVCLLVGNGLDASNQALTHAARAEQLDGCIRWLGARTDIPAVMNALDVHVLSSATESFPNVVVEAMACGIPCVATDVGDTSTIIADTGWVAPPKNPSALADAIHEAIEEFGTPRWQDRRTAARTRIFNKFSIEKMVSNYNQVWQACLRRARRAQATGMLRACS
jgi:glycosyltransferase involved in cell wall biosynthesis